MAASSNKVVLAGADAKLREMFLRIYPWTLTTKYYTAKLDIWSCDAEHPFTTENTQVTNNCQALIFLYDESQPNHFESISKWSTLIDQMNPSCLLCLAYTGTASTPSSSFQQKCDEWCQEYGIELVKDNLDEEPLDTSPKLMPPKEQLRLDDDEVDFDEDAFDEDLADIEEELGLKISQDNPMSFQDLFSVLCSLNRDTKLPVTTDTTSPTPTPATTDPSAATASTTPKPEDPASDFFDDEFGSLVDPEEKEFAEFESAVKELKQLRQKADQLPDQQRKQLAANVAMAFYAAVKNMDSQ